MGVGGAPAPHYIWEEGRRCVSVTRVQQEEPVAVIKILAVPNLAPPIIWTINYMAVLGDAENASIVLRRGPRALKLLLKLVGDVHPISARDFTIGAVLDAWAQSPH